MRIYEVIYDVLFTPAEAMRRAAEEKPVGQAAIIVILIYVFSSLVNLGLVHNSEIGAYLPSMSMKASILVWYYLLIGLPVTVILWLLGSAVYSMIGSLLFEKNNTQGLLAGMAFAMVPSLLAPPLQYIGLALEIPVLSVLTAIGLFLWTCGLQIIAVRETLDLDTGQAVTVWFILPVVLFAIILLAVFAVIGMAFSLV